MLSLFLDVRNIQEIFAHFFPTDDVLKYISTSGGTSERIIVPVFGFD